MGKITEWATKKMQKAVQTAVVEPVKQDILEVKDDASKKIGLITNVIRFVVCFGIGCALLKDHRESEVYLPPPKKAEPTTIVINNYINEGGKRNDYGKPRQPQKCQRMGRNAEAGSRHGDRNGR